MAEKQRQSSNTRHDKEVLKALMQAEEGEYPSEFRVLKAAMQIVNETATEVGKAAAESKYMELRGTNLEIEREKRIGKHGREIQQLKHEKRINTFVALAACAAAGFAIYGTNQSKHQTGRLQNALPALALQADNLENELTEVDERSRESYNELARAVPRLQEQIELTGKALPILTQTIKEIVPLQIATVSNQTIAALNRVDKMEGSLSNDFRRAYKLVDEHRTHYFDIFKKHAGWRTNDTMVVAYLQSAMAALSDENDRLNSRLTELESQLAYILSILSPSIP